ncbi:MAG: undecaprenyl/decaprenyl-phosphate alpha-N-acetylglucosaminyl 1-phosphate transferase [Chrysiogenetes bacterium]|nr:undecaprenyl/decaprenyl-phosphate alpha-N-acetylglucosaminyl 1-phosphate transferase [Chrysiogenetes bacterium]
MPLPLSLVIFFVAAGLAAAFTPLVRKLALRTGLLDHPGERKAQNEAIPYLGGLAVFAAFALVTVGGLTLLLTDVGAGVLGSLGFEDLNQQSVLARGRAPELTGYFLGALVCVGTGLLDDIYGARFPARLKLLAQFVAAILAVAGGVHTTAFGDPTLNFVISVIWIVAITNALNFVDNMDGLAGGLVIISGLILWAVALQQGQLFMQMILLAFVGAAAGFLPFNFHPASIYLGDTGSLFLGFTMGVLTTLESYVTQESSTLIPIVLPVIVLSVPVFDMVSVIVIRLREGRPIYIGDRSHLSHRLVALGMHPRTAVLFLYLLAAGLGFAALPLPRMGLLESIYIVMGWVLMIIAVTILMIVGRRDRGS